MSNPNQPSRPPSWQGGGEQPPDPQQSASGWGQHNSAWGQPNPTWNHGAPSAAPRAPRGGQAPAPTAAGQHLTAATAPLGRAQQPTVSLDQFRTKRNRVLPALVLVMGLLVVAGLLYFGTRVVPLGDATPTPSPTVTSSAPRPTPATPGANANSIRFESQQVGGIFTINDSHWDGRTLVVNLTVSVDQGSLDYTFLSMDVETGDISEMDPPRPGDLTGGIIDAGSEVTGTVRVTKTRGDTQLLLGDAAGRNLTMLLVSG